MTYRIEFTGRAADATLGLGHHPFKTLYALLTDVARDPREATYPDGPIESPSRWAPFGAGLGLAHFEIDDAAEIVRVVDVVWLGD